MPATVGFSTWSCLGVLNLERRLRHAPLRVVGVPGQVVNVDGLGAGPPVEELGLETQGTPGVVDGDVEPRLRGRARLDAPIRKHLARRPGLGRVAAQVVREQETEDGAVPI